MKSYAAKRKDPRWLRKRSEVLTSANFMCQDCGTATDSYLEVHHCIYIPRLEPWDYPNDLLMALCEECHEFRQARELDCHVRLARHLRLHPPHMLGVFAELLVEKELSEYYEARGHLSHPFWNGKREKVA